MLYAAIMSYMYCDFLLKMKQAYTFDMEDRVDEEGNDEAKEQVKLFPQN